MAKKSARSQGDEEKDPKQTAQDEAEPKARGKARGAAPEGPQGDEDDEGEDGQPEGQSPEGEARGGPEGGGGEDFGSEAEAQRNRMGPESRKTGDPVAQDRVEEERGRKAQDQVRRPRGGGGEVERGQALGPEEVRMVGHILRAVRAGHGPRIMEALQGQQGGPQGGQDRPPTMSRAEIEDAQRRESEAVRAGGGQGQGQGRGSAQRGMTSGETDPSQVPILQQYEGDPRKAREGYRPEEGEQPEAPPDRPLNEGEVGGVLSTLRTKGDTAYMHPAYAAAARERVMGGPRGASGDQQYRIIGSHQIGAVAGPERGGPDRAYTLSELGLTESQIPRLIQKGVLVEDARG